MEDPFRRHREFNTIFTLLPIGSAPRIDPKLTLPGTSPFSALYAHLRRETHAEDIHLYVNNQFEPSPDQFIGDIAKMVSKRPLEGGSLGLSVYYSVGRAYV